jgi:hypothetical protein
MNSKYNNNKTAYYGLVQFGGGGDGVDAKVYDVFDTDVDVANTNEVHVEIIHHCCNGKTHYARRMFGCETRGHSMVAMGATFAHNLSITDDKKAIAIDACVELRPKNGSQLNWIEQCNITSNIITKLNTLSDHEPIFINIKETDLKQETTGTQSELLEFNIISVNLEGFCIHPKKKNNSCDYGQTMTDKAARATATATTAVSNMAVSTVGMATSTAKSVFSYWTPSWKTTQTAATPDDPAKRPVDKLQDASDSDFEMISGADADVVPHVEQKNTTTSQEVVLPTNLNDYNTWLLHSKLELFDVYFSRLMTPGSFMLCQEIILNLYSGSTCYKIISNAILHKLREYNRNLQLLIDGSTSGFIYDNNYWNLLQVIIIARHSTTPSSVKKFSNAYILEKKDSNNKYICIVNIHLKALEGVDGVGKTPEAKKRVHVMELANILHELYKTINPKYKHASVFLMGDYNSVENKPELLKDAYINYFGNESYRETVFVHVGDKTTKYTNPLGSDPSTGRSYISQ